MNGIRLVVGLGNPGPRYEQTRHNAGFLVLERILSTAGGGWSRAGAGPTLRDVAMVRLGGQEIVLARPLTFMNRSGEPVAELLRAIGWGPGRMLVVVDDVALPAGRLRLRPFGGTGGHNGLKSIRDLLDTGDYPRLRVGVGSPDPGVDLADFVLEALDGPAWDELKGTVTEAVRATEMACAKGLSAAMDQFNRDLPAPGGEADGAPGGNPGS